MSSFEEEEKAPNEAEEHLIQILNKRKSSGSVDSNSPPDSPLGGGNLRKNLVRPPSFQRINSGLGLNLDSDEEDAGMREINVKHIPHDIRILMEKEDPVEEYKADTLEGASEVYLIYIYFFNMSLERKKI